MPQSSHAFAPPFPGPYTTANYLDYKVQNPALRLLDTWGDRLEELFMNPDDAGLKFSSGFDLDRGERKENGVLCVKVLLSLRKWIKNCCRLKRCKKATLKT